MMMMISNKTILSFLVVQMLVSYVSSFPSRAGACVGGQPTVFGPHLGTFRGTTIPVYNLTLADAGVNVTIGSTLLSSSTTNEVKADELLEVKVEAVDFKGVLVRVEGPPGTDMTGVLVNGTNTQPASVCTFPVVGITHTGNYNKSIATGTMLFNDNYQGVYVDVNVVFQVNAVSSVFAYGRFKLNFSGKGDCTKRSPCHECVKRDCDSHNDCLPGLVCADKNKQFLKDSGYDERKAYCGNIGAWNWELCYNASKIIPIVP